VEISIRLLYFSLVLIKRRKTAKPRRQKPVPPLVMDGTGVDPLQVCSAGTWPVQRASTPLHRHLVLELLWNEAPMSICLLDRFVLLKEPTVVLLPPGTPHIAKSAQTSYSRRKIGRDISIRREVFEVEGNPLNLRAAILPPRHTALVLPLLRHIHSRMRAASPPSRHHLSTMLSGLCSVLHDLGYSDAQPSGVVKGAVERALSVLYARHADPTLRVNDLARAAFMSQSHFRKIFSEQTGQSPHKLLTRLRRLHVRRLKEQRNLKASAIAAGTGFGSVSAMYKQLSQNPPSG
jgi:AraC-like DNA-binding protein